VMAKSCSLKMMAVPVKVVAGVKPSFQAGTPVALFDAHLVPILANNVFGYDVLGFGLQSPLPIT
jgi:hypothetical protein